MKRSQWGETLSQVVVFELFVDNDVTKFISSDIIWDLATSSLHKITNDDFRKTLVLLWNSLMDKILNSFSFLIIIISVWICAAQFWTTFKDCQKANNFLLNSSFFFFHFQIDCPYDEYLCAWKEWGCLRLIINNNLSNGLEFLNG